jgi:carbonic anhydrase/acetyltransferase-like protein (isoleucine patch superfamily)
LNDRDRDRMIEREYKKANRLLLSFGDLYKTVMGLIAYHIPYPSFLSALLHKMRGVRIKNIWTVFIAYHVVIDSVHPDMVEIEDGAWLTREVKILAHFNPTPLQRDIFGGKKIEKVKIGKGAFIGVGAIILPGVTVGEGALVGPGSVVTKDVADYVWVAGNPAQQIKSLRDLKTSVDNDTSLEG